MKDQSKEIDLEAMRAEYDKSGTPLSYEEWFAMRVVDGANGDETALIYKDAEKLPNGKKRAKDTKNTEESTEREENTTQTQKQKKESRVSGEKHTNQNPVKKDTRVAGPIEEVQPKADIEPGQINALADVKPPVFPEHAQKQDTKPEFTVAGAAYGMTYKDFGLSNEKQFLFCLEYIKDFNATRSYKAAGYIARTENAYTANAARLIANDKVQHAIKRLTELRAKDVQRLPTASELAKDANAVLLRVAQLANADIGRFVQVGSDGLPFYDFSDATPDDFRSLVGLKVEQGVRIEYEGGEPVEVPVYKIEPKMDITRNLHALMKHHGLLVEKVEIEDKTEYNHLELARRLAFILQKGARENKGE